MNRQDENISGIRAAMKKMKAELYAIKNSDLIELDEYIKNLYLQMLCTIIQYENEPSEMQILYFERVMRGMQAEELMEEYMRKALEISDNDVQEFLSYMRNDLVRFYFALDGIILASMGNQSEDNYEYLAELIELCGIVKDDLEFLSLVSRSVLEQDSSCYDDAKKKMSDHTKVLNFIPYISNYYAGAIIDTETEKYYSAPDYSASESIELPKYYDVERVTFANLAVKVDEDFRFNGCQYVIFKNCKFTGSSAKLNFDSVGNIMFEGCSFDNFENRVAVIENAKSFIIKNCKFILCGYTSREDGERGGIFSLALGSNASEMDEIVLEGNEIHNCYIKGIRFYYALSGVFLKCPSRPVKKMIVKGNTFSGCKCEGSYNNSSRAAMIGRKNIKELINEGNIATGEVTRLFEE